MKKYLVISSLLLVSTFAKAQQSVMFKIKYLPGHTYEMSNADKVTITANLSGDTAILNKLKKQGITSPVTADVNIVTKSSIKSGLMNKQQTFPVTITPTSVDGTVIMNGKIIPIPQTKPFRNIMYAHAGLNGLLEIDSLQGQKLNDSTRKKAMKILNGIESKIKFPDHPLKRGDTFTQGIPINIPIQGSNLDINSTITYKLISIANGMAYFDVAQTVSMDISIKTIKITLSGAGTGKLIYNMKYNYPVDLKSQMSLKASGQLDKLNVDGTFAIDVDQTTVIN